MRTMTVLQGFEENNKPQEGLQKCVDNVYLKTIKKRLPILDWLPKYNLALFAQDAIAGLTVGLTAIPQGIAYAIIAGLPPEYGLYASLTSGIIYAIFGTCTPVTVGPTSILATLTGKYVMGYSTDIAVLATFMTGILQIFFGVFQLGFLTSFISMPVITGFTTGAALQISASQLKALFGTDGGSGHNFAQFMYIFFSNIKSISLADSLLGGSTIIMLVLLKKLGDGCSRTSGRTKQVRWFISLARNAVAVVVGMIIAYIIKTTKDSEPMDLIGDINGGLPKLQLPPFSTVIGNVTYNFTEMLNILGPQSVVIPLVAILEIIAIAKAFAVGGRVDATQEMIAIGMCNLLGSFTSSMPITGSISRSAINFASGVQTTFGGIVTSGLILLTLSLLTSTFYYIPKATLAGLIITAMYSMVHFDEIGRVWRNSKREFVVFVITVIVCLFFGLEYGILTGVMVEAAMLLFTASRPKLEVSSVRGHKTELLVIPLSEIAVYCSAEHIRKEIMKVAHESDINCVLVLDGSNVRRMDITVAENLASIVKDVTNLSRKILLSNFSNALINLCIDVDPNISQTFILVSNFSDLATSLQKRSVDHSYDDRFKF